MAKVMSMIWQKSLVHSFSKEKIPTLPIKNRNNHSKALRKKEVPGKKVQIAVQEFQKFQNKKGKNQKSLNFMQKENRKKRFSPEIIEEGRCHHQKKI